MIRKLVIVLIALISIKTIAQEGTASPYSYYGIGSLKFKGTVENRSMGGLSIIADSAHINLRNPASFANNNLQSIPFNGESRPVKFAVGGSQTRTTLKSNVSKDDVASTTFDYIAVSIPIGKFGVGFGLLPYTSVGYKLQTYNSFGAVDYRYTGEGGVNKAFLSVGYKVTPKLSVGADFNYNFGNINNQTLGYRYDDQGFPLRYLTLERSDSNLSGANFNFGAIYNSKITERLDLTVGVTFSPKANLTSKNERSLSINTAIETTIQEDLAAVNLAETKLTLPTRYSIGAGIGQARKWFAGIEYGFQKTSQFKNAFNDDNLTTYKDASNFSLGGYYIPKYNSFSGYWKRVVYRAGFRMENTGIVVNGEDINEFGISFGLGLPVGRYFSSANIGFEYGQRGTTTKNLIQENFFGINLGLTLSDRWFQKRKYN